MSAVHGIDYLTTWNCKHIANATLYRRIMDTVERAGLVRQPIQDGLADQAGAGEACSVGGGVRGGQELGRHRDKHARGLLACRLGGTATLPRVPAGIGDPRSTRRGKLGVVGG